MKHNLFYKILILFIIMLILFTCKKQNLSNKKIITVSILPQKYLVERITGDNFEINVMVRPGFSPHDYAPLPDQMKKISKSLLYMKIGVPFEKVWLNKMQEINPEMKIINTAKGITSREFRDFEDEHHDEHKQNHEGKDPHIWLSPSLVKIQCTNIYRAVIKIDPENTEQYTQNYNNFIIELDNLSKNIKKAFEKIETKEIMVFHPAWGYFTDEFGLIQIPIEIEGKEPTPKQLVKIIDKAREHNIKVIFIQKQFSRQSAEAIADEIGAAVISIDPLSENYIENLNNISKTIINSLK